MLYFFPSSLGLPFHIEVDLTMKRFTNIYLAKNTNNRSLAGLLAEVICEWLDGLYRFFRPRRPSKHEGSRSVPTARASRDIKQEHNRSISLSSMLLFFGDVDIIQYAENSE